MLADLNTMYPVFHFSALNECLVILEAADRKSVFLPVVFPVHVGEVEVQVPVSREVVVVLRGRPEVTAFAKVVETPIVAEAGAPRKACEATGIGRTRVGLIPMRCAYFFQISSSVKSSKRN